MGKDIKEYFTDKVIKVDRGGPESRIGKVLDAGDDYFAVLTENDGVVYYNTHHIKSFTENMKGQLEFDAEIPKGFKLKKAENFKELLESLKYVWVKINRGGPDTVEGVLSQVKDDFVYLVSNKEIVRITMFHIKNVSYGVKIEKAESEDNESQREHQSRQKSNNKSKNKKNKTNSSTESEEYESQEYESEEYESQEYESEEYESQEYKSQEYSYGVKIEKAESEEYESQEYKSQEYSYGVKIEKVESEDNESQEYSYGVKIEKVESEDNESRQKLNDESKNKTNSSTEVDRQNFEDDLSVLLSSMEKFFRNYSKCN